jgi:IMP dehydrogenase
MRFVNDLAPQYDLTYSDVFMVPSLSDVPSRLGVDLTTPDGLGTTIPVVVANMTAVAGRRMAETVARRGGLTVLPQDIPLDVIGANLRYQKSRHPVFETAITLGPTETVGAALNLIHKRAHGVLIVVDDERRPIGIFAERDAAGFDRFTQLGNVMKRDLVLVDAAASLESIFDQLNEHRISAAPVVDADGRLVGVVTRRGALRSTIYRPALNARGELMSAVAVGISGNAAQRAAALVEMGVDVVVVDTAHGHQGRMLRSIEAVRGVVGSLPVVAGNVATRDGARDLINAGADIVKVGIGPGAMCTTRMMTGVGRPQFTAVMECADEAAKQGKHVWADGGVRYPRDVALGLAAGAASVMFGSWLAGTYESAADTLRDPDGRLYKESFGMASNRAVRNRTRQETPFERARKELFEEGISTSRMYLDAERPGVEDILDQVVAGVRSSCTYAGATTIPEFQERAVVGIQSAAGYEEGRPQPTSW